MAVQSPPSTSTGEISKTALYCYGVAQADAVRPQPDAGLAGKSVEPVRHGALAALTSQAPPGKVRARRADLLCHFEVLRRALDDGTVLPLRFGTVFESEEQLVEAFLQPRHDELVALLAEMRGRVELRVTAHYREEAILAEIVRENARVARLRGQSSQALQIELGELVAAELEEEGKVLDQEAILAEIVRENQRVARLREATRTEPAQPHLLELGELVANELRARTDRDARALLHRLGSLALDYEFDEQPIENQVLRASFLVSRERVPVFDAAMDELAAKQAGRIDFTYVGPLPPHSFVHLTHEGGS